MFKISNSILANPKILKFVNIRKTSIHEQNTHSLTGHLFCLITIKDKGNINISDLAGNENSKLCNTKGKVLKEGCSVLTEHMNCR